VCRLLLTRRRSFPCHFPKADAAVAQGLRRCRADDVYAIRQHHARRMPEENGERFQLFTLRETDHHLHGKPSRRPPAQDGLMASPGEEILPNYCTNLAAALHGTFRQRLLLECGDPSPLFWGRKAAKDRRTPKKTAKWRRYP